MTQAGTSRPAMLAGAAAVLLGVASLASAAPAASQPTGSLASLSPSHRVLLVFAPVVDDARLLPQRRIATDPGFAERDLVLVEVAGAATAGVTDPAPALRSRYGIARSDFRVLLIGKDGHVARTIAAPIVRDTLFGAIDAMPMRRDEMRRR